MFSKTAINFNDNTFSLRDELINNPKVSRDFYFILIVCPQRSGKSTLKNILINPTANLDK